MRSGQKSCLVEHSRLIILRNESESSYPKISLFYEYGGETKLGALQDTMLGVDGSGRQPGRVSPMAASEVRIICLHMPSTHHIDSYLPTKREGCGLVQ